MGMSHREIVFGLLGNAELNEYDWNGTGGLPAREDAANLVRAVYSEDFVFGTCGPYLPEPDLSLDGDGTISIAYDDDESCGKKLFLTFKCEGVITYMKMFEDDQTTIEGILRVGPMNCPSPDDFVELVELFEWISLE